MLLAQGGPSSLALSLTAKAGLSHLLPTWALCPRPRQAPAPGANSRTPLVGGSSAPPSSCPALREPQVGALSPAPTLGLSPVSCAWGHRAQALSAAQLAVFPPAWPFSDLDACLLGPLPLVRLEKPSLLSSSLPGTASGAPGEAHVRHFGSHAGPPFPSLFFFLWELPTLSC